MGHYLVFDRAVLPFWICLPNGDYDVALSDGAAKLRLENGFFTFSTGNRYTGYHDFMYGFDTLAKIKHLKEPPNGSYLHVEKARTFVELEHRIDVGDGSAAAVEKHHGTIATDLARRFLRAIHRLIEVYRADNTVDKIAFHISEYELSAAWHREVRLQDGTVMEALPLGLDVYNLLETPPFVTAPHVVERIRARLQTDAAVPMWRILLESAMTLQRKRSWRLAVIDAEAALELFLTGFLEATFVSKGYDATLREHLLHRTNIGTLIGPSLRLATGKSLSELDNSLNAELNNKLVKVRNDLIHRGQPVGGEESQAALEVVIRTIRALAPGEIIAQDAKPAVEPTISATKTG